MLGLLALLSCLMWPMNPAKAQNIAKLSHIFYEQGLPSNWVYAMVEDTLGHVWIAGNSGLTRFDGKTCKTYRKHQDIAYSLLTNMVLGLVYDSLHHKLICVHPKNISVLDITSGKVQHLIDENRLHEPWLETCFALPENRFLCLPMENMQDAVLLQYIEQGMQLNHIHLSAKEELDVRSSVRTQVSPWKHPNEFLVAKGNELWLLNIHDFTLHHILRLSSSPQDFIRCFDYLPSGEILLSLTESGLLLISPDFQTIRPVMSPESFEVSAIYTESDSLVWLGKKGRIVSFNPLTESFRELHLGTHSFEQHFVKTIFRSRNDVLFLGNGQGLFRYDQSLNRFQTILHINFSGKAEPSELFFAHGYLHPDKPLYFGQTSVDPKLVVTHLPSGRIYPLPGFEQVRTSSTLMSSWENQSVLILADKQIYRIPSPGDTLIRHPLYELEDFLHKQPTPTSFFHSTPDRHLVAAGQGWLYLQLPDGRVLKHENQEYLPARIFNILLEKDRALFNCPGICVLDFHSNSIFPITPVKEQTLPMPGINGLYKAHGSYFASTYESGLYELEIGKKHYSIIKHYNEENEIVSSQIVFGTQAPDSTLWFTTDLGILRFCPKSKAALNFSYNHNLQEANLYHPIHVNESGYLATNTTLRTTWVQVDELLQIARETALLIHSFQVENRELVGGKFMEKGQIFNFPYHQNSFKISWSHLRASADSYYQVEYKLQGYDDSWRSSAELYQAEYINVPPGRYTFQVSVRSRIDQTIINQLALPLHIDAPFWQRNWFRFLVLSLFLSLIYLFYRIKVDAIRKEEAIKTAYNKQLADLELQSLRSQMNPHFMFNSLNSIKHYILKNERHKAADYLTSFAKLIRAILHFSNEKFTSLEQELDTLKTYIELEQLRFPKSFSYQIDVSSDVALETTLIQPLIFQPFVENAIWHGLMQLDERSGMLVIRIHQQPNQLHCEIIDNGIGRMKAAELRTKSAARKSYGLEITEARIKNQDPHASLEIVDLYHPDGAAAGTKVVLIFPLNTEDC
jgi:hypothetical protein